MEQYEIELVLKYSENDPELKFLWEEHQKLNKLVDKLESKPFLTPEEDKELKELKKKKLAGKTRLLVLIQKYQEMEEE